MMSQEKEIKKILYYFIIFISVCRIISAWMLELSVDEVYYWTYALFPDWSHFEHPPMVGWIIQLFSLNLLFDNELALRIGPIVISVINTLIVYNIGKKIHSPLTGLYSAILFNASIYCSVIAGNFIMPDTPQLLFWLLSMNYLIDWLPAKEINRSVRVQLIVSSFCIGLAVLSKYHGVFLWAGAMTYILLYNRRWLKDPSLYLGIFISVLFVLPILIWNIQNEFITFRFHGGRVASDFVIRPDYFFTEIIGQFGYNNPVNFVLIIISLIALRKTSFIEKDYSRVLIAVAAPIWIVFTSFSLFRQTLPHWASPAYSSLIFIAAAWLSRPSVKISHHLFNVPFPKVLWYSLLGWFLFLSLTTLSINYYPGTMGKTETISKYGDGDFTLDMDGWKEIKTAFEKINQRDVAQKIMPPDAPIITHKYFPGTHLDYYVAKPLDKKIYIVGGLREIHKYAWINKTNDEIKPGQDAYCLAISNMYGDPFRKFGDNFETIEPSDTIPLYRSGKIAHYAFVYRMRGYKGNFPDPFLMEE